MFGFTGVGVRGLGFRDSHDSTSQNLPECSINHKGGRPPKSARPARILATGRMGGQARSAEAQIRHFQHNTHAPIFQKAKFSRLVKDFVVKLTPLVKLSSAALDVLTEATATFGVEAMVRAQMAASHRKRQAVEVVDFQLFDRMRQATPGSVCCGPPTPLKLLSPEARPS